MYVTSVYILSGVLKHVHFPQLEMVLIWSFVDNQAYLFPKIKFAAILQHAGVCFV